ncbi:glycosyltransferase [Halorarius halobius]|uniref:glycosyltransferase n=1 Tax=Halorarius halobius TaxID=2962671 RepID=UPI0020CB96CE|nr:hypothetical protein [Halorarius halobius]
MTGPPTVAVAHYPEGAGHATRMLAIANALRERGASVEMAGGGAGTAFVALNGYDEFEPTAVDYIDTYQGGSVRQVLAESVPATAARVAEYVAWLRNTEPDALVTDDMFAAIAATRTDVPLYVLKHDVPALYRDRIERAGAAFHTSFQLSAAREFFYPTVWPSSEDDPDGVTHVPPVALDGDATDRPPADVVVVPSAYSELGRIADHLARQGYEVLDVGSDEWETVPALLPYLRAADVVVCSGYSTVMDAAVAGTPCVVYPATDEQDAVADWLDRFDVTGFTVAEEPLDVLEAVASPPQAPAFENGADAVADRVLDDLRTEPPAATGRAATGSGAAAGSDATGSDAGAVARVDRGRRRVADRAVVAAAACGAALRAVAVRGRALGRETRRLLAAGIGRLRRSAARVARGGRRYGTAVAAMSIAALVVANVGARSAGGGLLSGLRRTAATVREGTAAAVGHASRAADRAAGLAARFRDGAGTSE